MNTTELNNQWLADDMPFALEPEQTTEQEVYIPPLKHKLHDDFEEE